VIAPFGFCLFLTFAVIDNDLPGTCKYSKSEKLIWIKCIVSLFFFVITMWIYLLAEKGCYRSSEIPLFLYSYERKHANIKYFEMEFSSLDFEHFEIFPFPFC